MSLYSSTAPTTSAPPSSSTDINALLFLNDSKWGGALGTGATLTYSFPQWSATSTPVFVGYNGSAYGGLNEPGAATVYGLSDAQQAAAAQAMQAWGNVANITYSKVADTSTDYGDVRFAFTSVVWGGAAAWGSPPSASPKGGDVWLTTGYMGQQTDWKPGSTVFGVLVHELGHTLGLKHPFDDSPNLPDSLNNTGFTVMAYNGAPHSGVATSTPGGWVLASLAPDGPMVGDIAAIQYLYGANTSYHSGDDTYTFDPSKPFLHTIWDAGGSDTVSIASYTLGSKLDLRPGHYSDLKVTPPNISAPSGWSLYDGTGALGIAYGATIENAVGGKGSDTIIGNDADNTVTGGAGNDTIDGGAGFNTAVYAGTRAQFTLARSGNSEIVSDSRGIEGQDTLTNIQKLQFADGGVVLEATGIYATVAKVVVAGVSAAGLTNGGNAGMALQLLAGGMSSQQLLKLASLTAATTVDTSAIASTGMAYDTISQHHAEQAYRLYQAAFNRTPDFGGVAFWAGTLEKGTNTLDQVAQGFLQSPEFQSMYGNLDTLHYVDQLYMNVLHRLPDGGGETFWVDHLSASHLTRAQTLAQFSESPENQANLVGVLNHGAVSA